MKRELLGGVPPGLYDAFGNKLSEDAPEKLLEIQTIHLVLLRLE